MSRLTLRKGRYEGRLSDGRLLCVLPDVFEMNRGEFSEQELYNPNEWLSSADGENCWIEEKRGPGRPAQGRANKVHVDLTLSPEVAFQLRAMPPGLRSKFVDDWLREHPVFKQTL